MLPILFFYNLWKLLIDGNWLVYQRNYEIQIRKILSLYNPRIRVYLRVLGVFNIDQRSSTGHRNALLQNWIGLGLHILACLWILIRFAIRESSDDTRGHLRQFFLLTKNTRRNLLKLLGRPFRGLLHASSCLRLITTKKIRSELDLRYFKW